MVQTESRPPADPIKPEEAAERAVDPTGLLDGEDPSSRHPDDIAHWIHAYSELIRFKESVLTSAEEGVERMRSPDSQKEAGEVDLTILTAELQRYRDRLQFWQRRKEEAQSPGA